MHAKNLPAIENGAAAKKLAWAHIFNAKFFVRMVYCFLTASPYHCTVKCTTPDRLLFPSSSNKHKVVRPFYETLSNSHRFKGGERLETTALECNHKNNVYLPLHCH